MKSYCNNFQRVRLLRPSKPATQNTSTRPRDAHGRPPLNPSSGDVPPVTNPSELSFELSPEQLDRNHPLRFSREEQENWSFEVKPCWMGLWMTMRTRWRRPKINNIMFDEILAVPFT
jgi:hypothetical protein